MVTGFSLVLYSRLHLILHSAKVLRVLLAVIVVNCVLVQSPLLILAFVGAPRYVIFLKVATFMSHLEIIFSVQEIILSSLYIYLFIRFVRQGGAKGVRSLKRTFYLLILAEVVIVVCDVALNVLLYYGWYLARRTILAFVYALKLQIEFLVLNRLARSRQAGEAQWQDLGVDVGARTALPELRTSTHEDEKSSPLSSPAKYPEAFSATSTGPSMNEEKPIIISEDTGYLFKRGSQSGGKMHCVERNSIEELERRYLGRFGADSPV
jgi:hypothetical protein